MAAYCDCGSDNLSKPGHLILYELAVIIDGFDNICIIFTNLLDGVTTVGPSVQRRDEKPVFLD